MDHQDAIQRIQAIEAAVDVAALRYRDLAVWPYVRLLLWSRLLNPGKPAPPAPRCTDLARHYAQVYAETANRTALDRLHAEHQRQMNQLRAATSIDLLLFSRVEDHADVFEGKHYNRHIDPMMATVRGNFRALKLELATPRAAETSPRYEPTAFVDSVDYVRHAGRQHLAQAFGPHATPPSLEGGEALFEALRRLEPGIGLTPDQVVAEAELLCFYRSYFGELLDALQPRAVMTVCYYYDLAMGLMAACRQRGLPAVDIQHGKQGTHHGLYTHWAHVPAQGYDLLPSHFWCWGEASRRNIEQDMPAHARVAHRVVIGGNRWLASWKNTKTAPMAPDPQTHLFLDGLAEHERVILVSLQPVEPVLPEVLIEAMRQAPLGWIWLIRLHPLQKARMPAVAEQLAVAGITRISLKEATDAPLYALLQRAHHHVTQWSSVAYEASAFGVPTTILGPQGAALFAEEIAEGHFVHADTGGTLLEALRQPAEARRPQSAPYIAIDDTLAHEALGEILTPRGAPARMAQRSVFATL